MTVSRSAQGGASFSSPLLLPPPRCFLLGNSWAEKDRKPSDGNRTAECSMIRAPWLHYLKCKLGFQLINTHHTICPDLSSVNFEGKLVKISKITAFRCCTTQWKITNLYCVSVIYCCVTNYFSTQMLESSKYLLSHVVFIVWRVQAWLSWVVLAQCLCRTKNGPLGATLCQKKNLVEVTRI